MRTIQTTIETPSGTPSVQRAVRGRRAGDRSSVQGILAFASTLTLANAGMAEARGTIPVLIQVTSNTSGTVSDPHIRLQGGEGIGVSFTSNGNVVGPAPGHNEIYFYDILSAQTTRVTTTTGGESRENARMTDTVGAADRPEQIVFISTGDLDPGVGNADHNPEVFIWLKTSNTFRQLTNTTGGVINQNPFNSDSGKCIMFSSTGNLNSNPGDDPSIPNTGYSNADGSLEVFQYSNFDGENYPSNGFITQISNGPAGTSSTNPVVGGYIFQRQCQTAAYVSDYDQTGEGYTGTNIYIYDRNSANLKVMETSEIPWTIEPGNYLYPSISGASPFARGPFVVFQTDADHWHNGSEGFEVFRYRVFHARMAQYTDFLDGSVERPIVSDGGGYITFQSTSELIDTRRGARIGGAGPFNADGNYEIFRTKGRRKVWQITESTGCTNDVPDARDDATSITFRSTCDLIPGRNPSHLPQVFLYRQVVETDPLGTSAGCLVANGCCNEANGCYQPIYGPKPSPRGKGCADSSGGCETLLQ